MILNFFGHDDIDSTEQFWPPQLVYEVLRLELPWPQGLFDADVGDPYGPELLGYWRCPTGNEVRYYIDSCEWTIWTGSSAVATCEKLVTAEMAALILQNCL